MQRPASPLPLPASDVESSLLGVLLDADTARAAAAALLDALAPSLDDGAAAMAIRDRDGLTLHVLAESGPPCTWPSRLEPQFAIGGQPGVDPATGTMVVPLRAKGRVVGALLLGDAPKAAALVRDPELAAPLETAAAVLHSFATRTEWELRRRAVAMRSVESILDGMAHQMANPLTGASAILQLLSDDLRDEGQRAAVGQIRQELGRAFTVLRDMLDFLRDTHAHDGVLDLGAIVERVIRFRGYTIRELGISLEFEAPAGFIPIRADASALEHALLTAFRFAEQRSHGTANRSILVQILERAADEVAVEITDSGAGDIPELAPAYFDLPLNGSRSSVRETHAQAPDLGLVDSILRGCGGRLEVAGSKSLGTTLTLVIPRAAAPQLTTPGRMSA